MTKEIELSRGMKTIVSDEDYGLLIRYRWYARPARIGDKIYTWYAVTAIGDATTYMHRMITSADKSRHVDHADGDGLNNTRDNLRLCSRSENMANARRTSPGRYRGVYKHGRKWRAIVGRNERGNNHYAGSYDNPEDAARAYDRLASQKWGEFATLNFP